VLFKGVRVSSIDSAEGRESGTEMEGSKGREHEPTQGATAVLIALSPSGRVVSGR
jgi:hypothetical protein